MKILLNLTVLCVLSICTLSANSFLTASTSEDAPVANFEANIQILPAAGSVQFTDLSTNSPETWEWLFEGGIPETSTEQFPNVDYPSEGSFDLQLIVSNAFGSDTLILDDYISVVGTSSMCNETSSSAGTGILYDSGGPDSDYSNDESCTFLIAPECANSITLSFSEFELWFSGDSLSIYDGNDGTGTLLLKAIGNALPPVVTANSGEMFIRFTSDDFVDRDGWVASWTSELSADEPTAEIVVSDENPPLGQAIQFTDASSEFPSSRLWDFGDGTTSGDPNPLHIYASSGTYEVTLIVENCFGADTTFAEIIMQDTPEFEIAPIDSLVLSLSCGASLDTTFYIINNGLGDLVVNTSNSIDFASDTVNVLSLNLFVIEEEFEIALSAIASELTRFNLTETDGIFENQLAPLLAEADVVFIPSQLSFNASILLSTVSELLEEYVTSGGKLLIGRNPDLQAFDFFPSTNDPILFGGNLALTEFTGPISGGVDNTFSVLSNTYTYDWTEDEEIVPLVVNADAPEFYIAAEVLYGQGQVLYCGTPMEESNENAQQLLANSMIYLTEFSEGGIIQSLSMDEQEVIHPGDSLQVNLSLSAEGIFPGIYTDTLFLETNDPDNDALTYLISMEVSGEATPALNADEITFSPILNGEIATDTLIVFNQGCESFSVEATLPSGFFSLSTTEFIVDPFSSDTIFVTYAPLASGAHSEVIEIVTTAGDFSVSLDGFAEESATINVTPENPFIDVAACADSVLVLLEVANSGEALLEFTRGNDGLKPLEEIRDNLIVNYELLTNQISDIYLFSSGQFGSSISNGGEGQYDDGNILNTNFETSIPYENGSITETDFFGNGSSYFTLKRPGLFALAADMNDVDWFSITGGLGAEGTGSNQGGELDFSYAGRSYKGFYTNTISTGTPSINHLIIVENSPTLDHQFLTTTDEEEHSVSGLNDTDRLYYLLFSADESAPVEVETMQGIFETFVQSFAAVSGFSADSVYQVEPGQSTEVETYLQVAGLEAGTYDLSVQFASNAPGDEQFGIPVTVEIDEAPCAYFDLDIDEFFCTGVVEFTNQSTNTADSVSWDFGDGNTSNEENPSHTYTAPDIYTIQLTVCSNGDCDTAEQEINLIAEFGPIPSNCQPLGGTGFLGFSFVSIEINDDMAFNIQESTEYIDLSCGILSDIQAGEENTYRIWFSCYTNLAYIKAQIDYNNDGVFTDDESIFDGTRNTAQGFSFVNIQSTFTAPGTAVFNYPLRYRVTIDDVPINDCNTDDGRTRDFSILILPPTEAPESSFEIDPIDECQKEYQFFDESSNAPNSWSWDFGDGNTSALQNPVHIFEDAGEYSVTLEASNDIGINSFNQSLDAPPGGISAIEATGSLEVGEPVLFSTTFEGSGLLNYDFGDGSVLETESTEVEHTYLSSGTYEVLVSTTADVCSPESSISLDIGSLSTTGNDDQDFLVYPNPSSGYLIIESSNGAHLVDVSIYDALGRRVEVIQTTIYEHKVRLNIPNPKAGMYFLLLTNAEGEVHHSRVILK